MLNLQTVFLRDILLQVVNFLSRDAFLFFLILLNSVNLFWKVNALINTIWMIFIFPIAHNGRVWLLSIYIDPPVNNI